MPTTLKILGTAQLSGNYGVLKQSVASSGSNPRRFLLEASHMTFDAFDTAPNYGSAEEFLGEIPSSMSIHTELTTGMDPVTSLGRPLKLLGRDRLDLVYLHDPLAPLEWGTPKNDLRAWCNSENIFKVGSDGPRRWNSESDNENCISAPLRPSRWQTLF